MKAIVIASLLFFGLRAMSAEEGENQASPCPYSVQSPKREMKIVDTDDGILETTNVPVSESTNR